MSLNIEKSAIIHIIGIGGIGMSGIAKILQRAGYRVQGSDQSQSKTTEQLIALGILVFHGHHESNIRSATVVIRSTAVKDENPEISYAKKHGLKVMERWEILREIMDDHHNITITGAHGKTTTTGLVGHLFTIGQRMPNILVGGIINNFSTNYVNGHSNYFIVEADESDATFIRIPSESAIVTNIDHEHLDFYHTFENIKEHYLQFLKGTSNSGVTAVCGDDQVLCELVEKAGMMRDDKIIFYGLKSDGTKALDIWSGPVRYEGNFQVFDIHLSEKLRQKCAFAPQVLQDIRIMLKGEHNVQNALGAVALALFYGIEESKIRNALEDFQGMKRRFTEVGELEGIKIIDDYAHHPFEIVKTLETARQLADGHQVIAILQPHRHTRLFNSFAELARSTDAADAVFVVDVYSAGEQEVPGYNSVTLVAKMKEKDQKVGKRETEYIDDKAKLFSKIKKLAKSGDYVLFLGAGDITKTAYDFVHNYANI